MSAKRAKQIRKVTLQAFRPFRENVEYQETGKHYLQSLSDMMHGNGGILVSDPVKLTEHCYRNVVKNTKKAFANLRQQNPLASNATIFEMIKEAA